MDPNMVREVRYCIRWEYHGQVNYVYTDSYAVAVMTQEALSITYSGVTVWNGSIKVRG